MSDQKVPTAPDYSPIINAYNSIAQHATTQGDNAYAWAKDQVANNQHLTDQVNSGNLDTQGTFQQGGKDQLQSGMSTQNDATGYLRNERDRYKDPSYVASDMGAAEAGVGQSFDAARNSSIQQLESYGVNPASTRFAGLDSGVRMQEAAAKAAAGTTAQRQDQQLADSANDKLLQQGNTQVGQASGTAGTGTNAGQASTSNAATQASTGANLLGTDLAWTGAGTTALNGQTNATNTGFQNQATADKMSNDSSSGIGSALGLGMSMASKFLPFAEGGAIPDAANGGNIPPQASPSGGAVTDDVPAQAPGVPNIRLNGGEQIIPKDVAGYLGQKFFNDLIAKSRKQMGAAIGDTDPPGGMPPGGQGPMERTSAAVGGAV